MTITFLIVSYSVLILVLLLMPKRLTKVEAYMTFFVVSFHTLAADLLFASIMGLYNIMGKKGPQISDFITETTLPALFGIIFVNFLPTGKVKLFLYIILWVLLSTIFEGIARYVHYLEFTGWKTSYSILFYIYACLFMIWHVSFTRKNRMK
ncbi:hypothetical protein [Metabacillus niabensis]|uniref:hypothetical protein n=1 Tax=Metabacillus TaxID=2675233 RepID=UPI000BA76B81|nr:hypothetical protein CHH83_08135 [Bacillus sp. 7586-K]